MSVTLGRQIGATDGGDGITGFDFGKISSIFDVASFNRVNSVDEFIDGLLTVAVQLNCRPPPQAVRPPSAALKFNFVTAATRMALIKEQRQAQH